MSRKLKFWHCLCRNVREIGRIEGFYLDSASRLYAGVYARANADGAFVGTSNKKLAFTSAPWGRVLIRITRVCLLCEGRVLSSEPRPLPRERGKERTRGWKLIIKAPNTAMPNLEFLPYSSAYIRDLGWNLEGSLPLGNETRRGLKWSAACYAEGRPRGEGEGRRLGVNRTK